MHAAKMSWTETVKTNHHQRIMPTIVNRHPHNVPACNSQGRACRFANPLTDSEIVQKIDDAVPMSTRKTTQWSIKLWEDWRQHRLTTATCSSDIPPILEGITNKKLNYWLSKFVTECRKQNGDYYRGGTLYSICSGIQRYVRERRIACGSDESLDIYKDGVFSYFRKVLDSLMKEVHKMGIGTTVKQAELISEQLEEAMWREGALGDSTPSVLLDTLVFMFGVHFALRSGAEHRQLRPDMIVLHEPIGKTAY